jgi:hypothetical protein
MPIPFELMYRLRFTPWELRPVVPVWQRITDGRDALPPGRALDVGYGTGRDACYLAGQGWCSRIWRTTRRTSSALIR